MKVINPNNTNHSITVIPRFDNYGVLTLNLYNEATADSTDVVITSVDNDGYLELDFTYDFTENDKYQIKLIDSNNEIVYRGKLLATTQETQEYQLTKDLFYYGG